MTAMLIVEPDWVLCVRSPFESTSCVPVQFPCEKQWSDTTLVSVAPVAGVETGADFCVCVAVSPGLPVCDVPPSGRPVGEGCESREPVRHCSAARDQSFVLVGVLGREPGTRMGEAMVESADTSDALYLRTLRTAAVAGRLELAIVLRHYGLVLAAGVRGEARTLAAPCCTDWRTCRRVG